jgi:hypothetical protein
MAIKIRDKLRQKFLNNLFELSNRELEEALEYITVRRYRTAGRGRTPQDFDQATKGIEQRMAAPGVTM